jgi:hypothetical protein
MFYLALFANWRRAKKQNSANSSAYNSLIYVGFLPSHNKPSETVNPIGEDHPSPESAKLQIEYSIVGDELFCLQEKKKSRNCILDKLGLGCFFELGLVALAG